MINQLELVNVSVFYGKGRTHVRALNNINLTIKSGEIILIMGPSGSGKTTLLSVAGGLLHPNKGKVILNGVEINKLKESELAKLRLLHTGFVFQHFNLLESLNTIENVEVALNLRGIKGDEAFNNSKNMLEQVGMGKRLHFYPNNLSGGEKQRVSIARALVNNPDLLFADEPTGNLDKASGSIIMGLFKKLIKDQGKSAVVVTHDERIKSIADRVFWLEDGQFISKKL